MSGTYELRSLTNKPTEGLFEGKLVVDKTYGYAAHGCMLCCGYSDPYMYFDPFNLSVGGYGDQYIWATDDCEGGDDDVTDYFLNGIYSWTTGNTQIATASNNQISAVAVGSTTNTASGYVPRTEEIGWGRQCPNTPRQPSGPVNVATVDFTGNAFIPLRQAPSNGPNSTTYTATGSPSGGSYQWSTTSSSIGLTNANSATVTVTAVAKSSSPQDIQLTVNYTAPNNGGSPTKTGLLTVIQPTSISLTSSDNTGTILCVPNGSFVKCIEDTFVGNASYQAAKLSVTYSILDQFAQPDFGGYGLQLAEAYTNPTGTCGPDVTTSQGIGDTITDCFYVCSETCRTGGTCSSAATQTITVNGFQVAVKNVTWSCAGATVQ